MIIANTNNHIAPYWGKEADLTPGLNQLGIRNVSEQLFSSLLPGLNNVSQRIRYYSFYCWIIHQFYFGKETIIDKEFNRFIRRSELLLALINATLEDRTGIPGINYAATQIDSGIEIFSIKDGADLVKNGPSTFWANPGGVLRQYYVASLVEIGLIGQHEKYPSLYNITKSPGHINGLSLANAFASSVGVYGDLFIQLVNTGVAKLSDLKELNQVFKMKYLSIDSEERNLLQQLILQMDNPFIPDIKYHRQNTIKLILLYLSTHKTTLKAIDFSKNMYSTFCLNDNLTKWGWYAYYLDNRWQYELTQIFHDVLIILKGEANEWQSIHDLLEKIASHIIDDFHISRDMPLKDLIQILGEIDCSYSSAKALKNLLILYQDNFSKTLFSENNYRRLDIHSENFGDFMKMVESARGETFYNFIKKIVEDVIYRHYRVSFRKMLQTGKATQKFAFENGCLRFIADWEATNSSPRIDTMRNFLIDLKIIEARDNEDALTEIGINLLKEVTNGNSAI